MWQLSRATFHHEIHSTLLQAWNPLGASNAPRELLPLAFDWLSNDLSVPDTTGLLFAFLHSIATALPAYILQGASALDTDIYLNDVSAFVAEYSVSTGFNTNMPFEIYMEMNDLIVEVMERIYRERPNALEVEENRFEILTSESAEADKVESLTQLLWEVPMVYLQVLIDTHLPLFRQRWTTMQYEDFVRGFVAGLHSDITIPVRILPHPVLYLVDLQSFYLSNTENAREGDAELELCDEDYISIGPRIPLDAFCQPIPLTRLPRDEICTICGTNVGMIAVGDESVVTACQHYFHAECLGSWVNDSAVRSANTSPDCRKEMCEARSRVPVYPYYDHDDGSNDDSCEDDRDELRRYLVQSSGETASESRRPSERRLLERVDEEEDFL